MAADDLAQANLQWPSHIQGLITDRHPATQFAESLDHHQDETIKEVIEWAASEQCEVQSGLHY
jgi:hypothetical protein